MCGKLYLCFLNAFNFNIKGRKSSVFLLLFLLLACFIFINSWANLKVYRKKRISIRGSFKNNNFLTI